jgi:hypothetical protein
MLRGMNPSAFQYHRPATVEEAWLCSPRSATLIRPSVCSILRVIRPVI